MGTVTYEGRAPSMKPIPNVDADKDCAKLHAVNPVMTEFLMLGEGQTVGNILVHVVAGLPEGKEYPVPEEAFEFTQKDCRYSPHVFAVRVGQKIRILNPDGLQHNVHAMPEENREFNKAMAKTTAEISTVFKKAEPMFKFKCDVHGWMEARCAVMDHPFYVVTETDGKFRIEGLAPGEYELEAWHEVMGVRTLKVTVKAGEESVQDFTFTRPQRK